AAAARRTPAAAPESPAARFGALLFAAAIGGTFLFADAAVLREPFVTRRLAREGGQYRPKEEARQIALLSRFERLAPNPEATRVLGDLLRSAGREAEACVVFERQWKADPEALDEGLNAADCRLRAGRGGAAEELARRILAGRGLSPGTELRARAALARALAARGAKKESVAQWRKVLGGATETRNALRLFDRLLDERRLDDALRFADRLAGAELGRGPDSPAAQAETGAVPALGGAGAEGRLPDAPPGRGDGPWSLTLGSPVAPAPKAPSGDVSAEFRYTADAARSLWASGDRALAARDIAGLRVPESSSSASRVQMLMLRAGVKADTNDFAGAEADIRAALALEPKNYEVLCRLVQFLRERNRLPESLAAARILVEVPTAPDDVNRAEKWLQRGETLLAMGRTDEAVADVRRALESKPGDVASLWLMIQALQRGGRSREALAFADRMVQAATSPSQRAEALGLRAKVRESLGQIQQAEEDSQSAVAADPGSTVALEARVQLLRSSGRLAEARVLADRMVAAGRGVPAPQRAVLLEQRAQVRSLLGDAGGAEADLRAALETDPDALTATRALASTMLARGVPAKALQLIDAAIKGAPTGAARAEGLTFRAQVLADMGRGAEAAADLKAAAPPETGAFDASAPARSARRLLAAGRAREAL
ncbi:MAG: hypothetical protein KGL74_01940, partial [Elusimicrobia bacterium]|nr:hypothetical protein [Elusimicrobiota bacterium]